MRRSVIFADMLLEWRPEGRARRREEGCRRMTRAETRRRRGGGTKSGFHPRNGSSLNRRCRRFRRWRGRNASTQGPCRCHLSGEGHARSMLLTICVICAICGSNCRFQVHSMRVLVSLRPERSGREESIRAGSGCPVCEEAGNLSPRWGWFSWGDGTQR